MFLIRKKFKLFIILAPNGRSYFETSVIKDLKAFKFTGGLFRQFACITFGERDLKMA